MNLQVPADECRASNVEAYTGVSREGLGFWVLGFWGFGV